MLYIFPHNKKERLSGEKRKKERKRKKREGGENEEREERRKGAVGTCPGSPRR